MLCGCARHPVDQKTLDHEFLQAVIDGKSEPVKELLAGGANVDAKADYGYTALLIVADRSQRADQRDTSQTEIVKLLLEKGANLEVRDQNGFTPLMVAARHDSPSIVRLLVDKGANVDAEDQSGETALTTAARGGNADVVDILLEKTPGSKAKDRALFAAIITAPMIVYIGGQQVAAEPSAGPPRDPWPSATNTVRLLLEKGAEIEARDEEGQTPLIRAASAAQTGIVKLLLDKGARIEARDKYGNTALMSTACGGCAVIDMGDTFDSARLLVARGASVEARNKRGDTALMTAVSSGQTRIANLLLEKGANIEDRDSDGNTPLILAAPSGFTTSTGMVSTAGTVKMLLDHHCDINARNKKGQTALMAAVSEEGASEASQIVSLLLSRGADTSIQDINGNTALTLAKKNGYTRAARLLMKAAGNSPQVRF
jgi:ankyrin repeat protein